MPRITKKQVKDFFQKEKDVYGTDLSKYSQEALVFSFLLGLPPAECTGMYLESDMDRETINLYYDVDNIIWSLRREKAI